MVCLAGTIRISMRHGGKGYPDKQNQISRFYANIRSIRDKRNEFIDKIKTEQPGMIAITETWLNDINDYTEEYSINGYTIINKNRTH